MDGMLGKGGAEGYFTWECSVGSWGMCLEGIYYWFDMPGGYIEYVNGRGFGLLRRGTPWRKVLLWKVKRLGDISPGRQALPREKRYESLLA